jgi:SAM-dependent methyltransferase
MKRTHSEKGLPLSGTLIQGTAFERFLDLLKRIPIDFGQGFQRYTTKGKVIALSLVPDGHGKKALDVGCEEGVQTKWLEGKGYAVTSIDHLPHFEGAMMVDVNLRLPFPDESFDLIWCSEVIEHLESPERTIQEFRRVLKPGGTMVLTTPNSHFWFFRLAGLFGLSPRRLQNVDHKHFFHLRDIRALFPDARLYGYFPYILFKCTIRRYLSLLTPTFVIEEQKMSRV